MQETQETRIQWVQPPGSGRENGNPLQDSGLEDPMGRGAWWATVQRVAELDTNELAHILFLRWGAAEKTFCQNYTVSLAVIVVLNLLLDNISCPLYCRLSLLQPHSL